MFKFKYFTIYDQNSAMKVGTDGVLLGAWITLPPKGTTLLDIGSGSGILSLIMAQRSEGCLYIDAIDIDEGAIKDSKKNFELSNWNSMLNPVLGNFVSYSDNCGRRYDTIVSNPPFFTEDTLSPDFKRASARNTTSLNFETLFQGVAKISKPNTIFAMIFPADNYSLVAQTALLNGFYLRRLTWVVTVEGTEPKRVLTEWGRVQKQFTTDTLIVSNRDGSFSADYKELTKELYL